MFGLKFDGSARSSFNAQIITRPSRLGDKRCGDILRIVKPVKWLLRNCEGCHKCSCFCLIVVARISTASRHGCAIPVRCQAEYFPNDYSETVVSIDSFDGCRTADWSTDRLSASGFQFTFRELFWTRLPASRPHLLLLFFPFSSGGLTLNPTEKIRPGMMGSETTVVTREITVAHFHPEMPEVYGTPFMIYLMEVAASKAIQPFLPAGWVSVGTEVNVKHLAATPLGRTVTATARVASLGDRLVTFSVEAHDGVEQIGVGIHVRAVIDLSRFERHLQAKR